MSPIAPGYKNAFKKFGWQVREANGQLAVRQDPRKRVAPYRVHALATAENHQDAAQYAVLRDYRYPPIAPDYSHPIFDSESQDRASARIARGPWWKSAHEIRNLLFFCPPEDRAGILQRLVAPAFFRRYPRGRVDFLSVHPSFVTHMHLLRKLYFMNAVTGLSPLEAMHIFPKTLARLFPFSAQYFPGAQLNLLFALFFPNVYAFAAPHGTSALIFHFGNPESGSQPFPASFEHWWRGDDLSVGNGGRAKSILRQLAAGHVPKEKPMFGAPIWTDEQWNGFFRWYVKTLGTLHSTVLDFAAFADENQNVQFETQFKALLSVMHIGVETQLIMTTLPSFLKKELTFDILDQYAALLAGGSDDQQKVAARFSHIVRSEWVSGPIRDALRSLPDPIGSHLADKALEVLWSDIRSSVLSGIFVDKRRPYGPTDEATAVSKTLRALRNTRHGFFLRRQVDEALAIHDGNISERLPELTALYWLSLLAEPKLFLGALMRA